MPRPKKQKGPHFSGRDKSDGVPLALAAVRHKTFLQHLPKCKHCGDIAMRGQQVCRRHGGAGVAARRGEYVPTGKTDPNYRANKQAFADMRKQAAMMVNPEGFACDECDGV